MNIDYDLKEQRRVHVRKKQKEKQRRENNCNSPSRMRKAKARRNAQIDRSKELQIMEGSQLLVLRDERYGSDIINKLPAGVKELIKVGNLIDQGITTANKDLRQRKMEMKEEKLSNARPGSVPTQGRYKEIARRSVVKNDLDYDQRSSIDREKKQNLKMVSTVMFWSRLPVQNYHKTLEEVIPRFWASPDIETLRKVGRGNKTALQNALRPYLKKIAEISDGKVPKEEYLEYSGGECLEHIIDKFDCLDFFLKVDNTDLPEISRKASEARIDARKAIFGANGTDISTAKRYALDQESNGQIVPCSEENMEEVVEFDLESLSF